MQKQKRPKKAQASGSRTYARNRITRSRRGERLFESDSHYLLKLVVYLLIGTLWIKFSSPVSWFGIIINALPLGVLAGVILVKQFEKHQADRKIWYAVLLIVGVMSYFAPAGVVI